MASETPPTLLDTAVRTNGITRPLKSGIVQPEGVSFNFIEVQPHIAAFRRMVRGLEFDVSEVAPTTYLLSKYYRKAFTALPVFMARGFHHGSLVCNPDAGIRHPKDLEGKRVGVRAYTVTTWIWYFGMLQSAYGVDPSKITFVTDDEDHVQEFIPPSNVEKVPEGSSLAELIAVGDIDAGFTGNAGIGRVGPPVGDWSAGTAAPAVDHSDLVPLFANPAELDLAWYRKTGVLPIHGLVVIKDSVVEQNPDAAPAIYRAFRKAKESYYRELASDGPVGKEDKQVIARREMLHEDPLPFGFERNRKSVQALADFVHEAGIVPTRFAPEELFVPSTLDLD
jgi:4,5-dihydroxyphthalate decarboxylase